MIAMYPKKSTSKEDHGLNLFCTALRASTRPEETLFGECIELPLKWPSQTSWSNSRISWTPCGSNRGQLFFDQPSGKRSSAPPPDSRQAGTPKAAQETVAFRGQSLKQAPTQHVAVRLACCFLTTSSPIRWGVWHLILHSDSSLQLLEQGPTPPKFQSPPPPRSARR